jgi:hypothetical protein
MDGSQFDTLLRGLRPRRGALLGLLGGTLGLLGLTESEAKHRKHKHKSRGGGSPPASPPEAFGPHCPGSCPVCQECVNGASCTVQSDFTPCGDDGCNVCKGGACLNRADGTHCGDNRRCQDGVCTPLQPSCADGIKNGDETDVDCGGSCDQCSSGQFCNTRTDCDTAHCSDGRCAYCATNDECGRDAAGPCGCVSQACYSISSGRTAATCSTCPEGTTYCTGREGDGFVSCFPRCGATL